MKELFDFNTFQNDKGEDIIQLMEVFISISKAELLLSIPQIVF